MFRLILRLFHCFPRYGRHPFNKIVWEPQKGKDGMFTGKNWRCQGCGAWLSIDEFVSKTGDWDKW